MIDESAAKRLAERLIAELAQKVQTDIVLVEGRTESIEQGWLFFFQSRACIETGDERYALVGNGPIFITQDGQSFFLSSGLPTADAIAEVLRI